MPAYSVDGDECERPRVNREGGGILVAVVLFVVGTAADPFDPLRPSYERTP